MILGLLLVYSLSTTIADEVKARVNASNFVKELFTDGFKAATAADLTEKERAQKLASIFTTYFHVPLIEKFVLGNFERDFNKAQMAEYKKLFAQYVVATYGSDLKKIAEEAQKEGGELKFLGEQYEKENKFLDTIVNTEFILARDEPVKIIWRVRQDYGATEQKIVGFYFGEGISLLHARKEEIASVIKRLGVDGFLEVLQRKVSELRSLQ